MKATLTCKHNLHVHTDYMQAQGLNQDSQDEEMDRIYLLGGGVSNTDKYFSRELWSSKHTILEIYQF